MGSLITTLGPKSADELGLFLPHEHVFSNFTSLDQSGYDAVPVEAVLSLMVPELERAQQAGVTALGEATSIGGGRRADVMLALSQAAGLPIVASTGIFREPWISDWAHDRGEAGLRDWMLAELTAGIGTSGLRAGWIKLRSGDTGLTPEQTALLRAAAAAGAATGAVIGSHTVAGRVARDQMDVIEGAGYSAGRFIWIHAQVEPDMEWNLQLARRGAWIEYDSLGDGRDDLFLERIRRMWDAGFGGHILLSHDRGWYDPAVPGGGTPQPYTYLSQIFIPKLLAVGFSAGDVEQMTRHNPFRAYAR